MTRPNLSTPMKALVAATLAIMICGLGYLSLSGSYAFRSLMVIAAFGGVGLGVYLLRDTAPPVEMTTIPDPDTDDYALNKWVRWGIMATVILLLLYACVDKALNDIGQAWRF